MSDKAEPRWLDASGAAAYVCLTESAFLRRVRAGTLPMPVKFEGNLFWSVSAIDALFTDGNTKSTKIIQ